MHKKAAIFGATGLVGKELLNQLLDSEDYAKVMVFNRRTQNYANQKIEEHIITGVNFDSIESLLIADDLYCCIGTTIKKAGSQEAFTKVDLDIPVNLARIAEKNKINKFLIVSSIGANAKAGNFYLRTKGKMEQKVLSFNIQEIFVFRPSMLLGARDESRLAEEIGQKAMKITGFLMKGKLKKYKAIPATIVACSMLKVAKEGFPGNIIESDRMWDLSV